MDYKDKVIKLLMSKELTEEQKDKLLDIFPELKESDDEKIRQELIETIHLAYDCGCSLNKEQCDKYLAWLEKQADHAKFINSIQVGDKVTRNEDGMLVNLSQLNRVTKKDEKQGEQKPIEEVKSEEWYKELSLSLQIEAYLNTASDELYAKGKPLYSEERVKDIHKCMVMWTKLHNSYFYSYCKQESVEWSDADETTKNNISHIIRQYDKISKKENQPCWYVGDCLLWMQNIKDRIQPQPRQEWSEEDKRKCNNIIALVEGKAIMRKDIKGLVNWLESLKERGCFQKQWKVVDKEIYVKEPALAQRKDKSELNHGYVICYDHTLTPDVYERFIMISDIYPQKNWKPSNTQMVVLNDIIINGHLSDANERILKGLQEQLKKLREE